MSNLDREAGRCTISDRQTGSLHGTRFAAKGFISRVVGADGTGEDAHSNSQCVEGSTSSGVRGPGLPTHASVACRMHTMQVGGSLPMRAWRDRARPTYCMHTTHRSGGPCIANASKLCVLCGTDIVWDRHGFRQPTGRRKSSMVASGCAILIM
jgi:hypothetical protein